MKASSIAGTPISNIPSEKKSPFGLIRKNENVPSSQGGPKIERILFSKEQDNKFVALPDLNLTIRSKGSSPDQKDSLLFEPIFGDASEGRKIF